MTRRRSTLTSIYLGYVSGAALTAGVWTSPRGRRNSAELALGFLARLGVWLWLIFGIGSNGYDIRACRKANYDLTRHQRRAHIRRAKQRVYARKHPAHDLEMLMRFAPDQSGRGLTLNQYRERFTRISVLGRQQIYCRFFAQLFRFGRKRRGASPLSATLRKCRIASCHAPLWPD